MKRGYFDDLNENVAFERCIDVLAELIEKYAGRFVLRDAGYEYWGVFYGTSLVTVPFSLEDYAKRCRWYQNHFRFYRNEKYRTAKHQIDRKAV